jgi:tetratricopeptide (TPR) repeat protein
MTVRNKILALLFAVALGLSTPGRASFAQQSVVQAYIDAANKTEDLTKKSELLRMAVQEAELLKDPGLLAGPIFLLGVVELTGGNTEKAKALFEQSTQSTPGESGKALFNSKAGNALSANGRLQDALVFYKSAVRIREQINPPGSESAHILAQVLKDLASCEQGLGNYTAAEVLYERAIELASSVAVKDPNVRGFVMAPKVGLASVRIAQGKPEEASALAREALGVFEEKDNHLGGGQCLFILGQAKELEGANESALALYRQSITAFDKKGKQEGAVIIPVLEKTVAVLLAVGEAAEADKLSERLARLRKKYNRD